jgi:hypothetical protein
MVRDAGNHDIVLIDRNDAVHYADRDLLALQRSALLDVEFDVRMVRALVNQRGIESLRIPADSIPLS